MGVQSFYETLHDIRPNKGLWWLLIRDTGFIHRKWMSFGFVITGNREEGKRWCPLPHREITFMFIDDSQAA